MTDPLEVSERDREEEWRAVKDSNERYEVSSAGRVRNARRKTIRTPNMNSCGYARIVFLSGGKRIRKFVHRCVAEAFIPSVDGKTLVDHIDGDRTNNRVENLRWTTQSENLLNGKVRKDKKHSSLRNIVKCGKKFRWKVILDGVAHHGQTFATDREAYADLLVHAPELSPYLRIYPLPASLSA